MLRFLKNLFNRKPKPSDYIGKSGKEISQTILAVKGLKEYLTWKKKKEELRIIRELEHDENEVRRIP